MKQGETIVITERNVPVAKLVPVWEKTHSLFALPGEGVASWRGGKPCGLAAPPAVNGPSSIAALVEEDRR